MDGEEDPPPWWFMPAIFAGMAASVALVLAAISLLE